MFYTADDLGPHVAAGLQVIESLQKARGRIWRRALNAEAGYARKLRAVAGQVDVLVRGLLEGATPSNLSEKAFSAYALLSRYADFLGPWAKLAADLFVAEVAARNRQSWFTLAEEAGENLQQQILHAPVGAVMQDLVRSQVHLIKSLPLEAAERVQTLAIEGVSKGQRYSEIVDEIMRTGEVAKSRAMLIARTETSRAGTALTHARAQSVGATHYRWLSAHDAAVRPMHRKLDGYIFAWDDPPVAEANGERHHPGNFPNCRCVAVVIPPPAYE